MHIYIVYGVCWSAEGLASAPYYTEAVAALRRHPLACDALGPPLRFKALNLGSKENCVTEERAHVREKGWLSQRACTHAHQRYSKHVHGLQYVCADAHTRAHTHTHTHTTFCQSSFFTFAVHLDPDSCCRDKVKGPCEGPFPL